jgi:PAS domain S-box-containing protein
MVMEWWAGHLPGFWTVLFAPEEGGGLQVVTPSELPLPLEQAVAAHREYLLAVRAGLRRPDTSAAPAEAEPLLSCALRETALSAGWRLKASRLVWDVEDRFLAAIEVFSAPEAAPPPEPLVESGLLLARCTLLGWREMTERRAVEQRLQALADSRHESVAILARDGRYEYINHSVLGYDTSEIQGRTFWQVLHPGDRPAVEQAIETLLAESGATMLLEVRARHRDASWRTLEVHARNLLDHPDVRGIILRTRDITERRKAEAELAASEERFRNLFEYAGDLIFTHDLNGLITSFNQTAERVTGYSRHEALTMSLASLLSAEHQAALQQAMDCLLGGQNSVKYRLDLIARNGASCPTEVSSRLIFQNGRPAGVQSIARDIRERQRLEFQLLQAQKMEAIGRLAGGVAHDFNNLLTVITGYTQWILDELPPDHRLRQAATETLLAADRASALTNQLLAFSRSQVYQPEPVDLNMIVARLDRMLRRIIGEDIELTVSMAPRLGRVRADAGQLEQVLLNLVVNARDAMPAGGRLLVETADVDVRESDVAEAGCPPGQYVMILVADTGCGMDAKTKERIFEPFFTTKEKGKGTGLGLATVYGILSQNNGYVTVESEPGQGSVFRVYLPRLAEPAGGEWAVPREAGRAAGGETILLVEDEGGVRRVIREMLERHGYHVLEAADGYAAEWTFRAHDAAIDLLITDVVMPEINGRELAALLTALRPGLKVLFISGYTDDAILQNRIINPGVSFLQKPFTPDTLARKVREVLDGA